MNHVIAYSSTYYTRLLAEETPFVFTRWGDGEWAAMLQKRGEKPGQNCDGHVYFPGMADALRAGLLAHQEAPAPHVYHGLLAIARRMYDAEIANILPAFPWVNGDVLLEAFLQGNLSGFFGALSKREVFYVGPARLQPLGTMLNVSTWLTCPVENAWLSIETLFLQTLTVPRGAVLGLSCGPAAKVLAMRAHHARPDLTLIDFGSMFDGVVGLTTRSYHKGRDWNTLARQML